VLGHVGQSLLGYAQQGHFHFGMQRPRVAGGLDLGGHAAGGRPAGHLPGQRVGQLAVLQRLRAQRLHRAAGVGQAVPGQTLGVADAPLAFGLAGGLLGGLELGDDPGQALGQRVVDLPGHPLPFVARARLPSLGQQLGLQAGVLGHHLFHPLVGLGQLGDHPLTGPVLLLGFHPEQHEHSHQRHVDEGQHQPDSHLRHGRPVESPALSHGEEDRYHRCGRPAPRTLQVTERVQEPHPGEERKKGTAEGEQGDERDQAGDVEPGRPRSLHPAWVQDGRPGDPGPRRHGDADRDGEGPGARPEDEHVRDERDGEQDVLDHPRQRLVPALQRG